MKQKIKNAFSIAKRIVSAWNEEGYDVFRSRIVTVENMDENPIAEVLVVFSGKVLKQVQFYSDGLTYTKNIENEAEAIEDIYGVITELQKAEVTNLIWLGE